MVADCSGVEREVGSVVGSIMQCAVIGGLCAHERFVFFWFFDIAGTRAWCACVVFASAQPNG